MMAKMSNLRRTAADVKADKAAMGKEGNHEPYVPPEDDGARFELEHHHLMKMGLGGDLKSGDNLEFSGRGTVEKSETRSSPEGDRHSATIRFHKGGVDSEAKPATRESEGKSLRGELAKNAEKIPEKADGK